MRVLPRVIAAAAVLFAVALAGDASAAKYGGQRLQPDAQGNLGAPIPTVVSMTQTGGKLKLASRDAGTGKRMTRTYAIVKDRTRVSVGGQVRTRALELSGTFGNALATVEVKAGGPLDGRMTWIRVEDAPNNQRHVASFEGFDQN